MVLLRAFLMCRYPHVKNRANVMFIGPEEKYTVKLLHTNNSITIICPVRNAVSNQPLDTYANGEDPLRVEPTTDFVSVCDHRIRTQPLKGFFNACNSYK